MKKSYLTQAGLDILSSNLANGDTVQYWIGYYGLAYLPEDSAVRTTPNPDQTMIVPVDSNGKPLGDVIYNVFQGSMADTVAEFVEGNTEADQLYKQCLYAENVESTFRYVLTEDANGNKINTLVAFEQSDTDPSSYSKKYTYYGVGGTAVGTGSADENGLPIPAPLYYDGNSNDGDSLSVSADMRFYNEKSGMWAASNAGTRNEAYANTTLKKSISNFNRYHAPSTSEGYAVAYQPACRNMAMATKLFPIEHYQVVSTANKTALVNDIENGKSTTTLKHKAENDGTKVDTVKYTIRINLKDYIKAQAKIINNPNAPKTSFKFNRIGIYAVPVSLHAFNVVTADTERCGGNKVQIEIDGDAEPKLFGIIDFDTVEMSEDAVGDLQYNFEVRFKLDSQLVDDTAIYYNLYEDDAITWYKNQLIANASIAEAVTTLTAEVGYLRNLVESLGNGGSCSGGSVCGSTVPVTQVENRTVPILSNVVVITEKLTVSDDNSSSPSELNPLSSKYLEKIDDIFSHGLTPVVAYRIGQGSGIDTPKYNGGIFHYAHLCGIGNCAYMFYDPAYDLQGDGGGSRPSRKGVYIRIRTDWGGTGKILATHYVEEDIDRTLNAQELLVDPNAVGDRQKVYGHGNPGYGDNQSNH